MLDSLPTATALTEVLPGVLRWAVYSPAHKVELTSHAVSVDGWMLIFDPIPLAPELRAGLLASAGKRVVVLTNSNHERDSHRWSLEFAAPIWSLAGAFPHSVSVCSWRPNITPPVSGWTVFPLIGGAPGEVAFFHANSSLMVFGDAVVNLPERQLELLPASYCEDIDQLRNSMMALPQFERAVFAHGQPLLSAASERIAALL